MSNDQVIADPIQMEEFGNELDKYVRDTAEKCERLIGLVSTATACGSFSGDAEQEAAQKIIGWLKAVQEPLPNATSMAKALRDAAEIYIDAGNLLKGL